MTSESERTVFRPGDDEAFGRAMMEKLLIAAEKGRESATEQDEVTVQVQLEYRFEPGELKPCCKCWEYYGEGVIVCKGKCC